MGEKSPLVLILAVLAGLAIVGVGIFFIVKYAGNKDSSGDTHIHNNNRTYGEGKVGSGKVFIPASTTVIYPAPTPSHSRTYGSGRVGGSKSGGLYDPATQGHGASGNPNASRHRETHSDVFDPAKQGQKAAGNPNTGGDGVFRPGAQGHRGAGNPNFGRG